MDMLNTLGGDMKTAFIVWILIKYALCYLIAGGVAGSFFILIYKIVYPIINHITNIKFMKDVMTSMGYHENTMSESQKEMILKVLNAYKNQIISRRQR